MTATTTRKTAAAKKTPAEGWITEATMSEVLDSITGYDELAIEQELKRTLDALAGDKNEKGSNTLLTRALIAVHRRHEGDSHARAWKYAMDLTMQDVQRYFTPESKNDGDVMTPELISESGKGAA